jgi:hypothetical protein
MDLSQGAMRAPSFRIVICSLAGLDAELLETSDDKW